MRVSLRKFFAAYKGTAHQMAAIELLADELPDELLDKFSDWVVCFEVDGEVDPLPDYTHKGYKIKVPWD